MPIQARDQEFLFGLFHVLESCVTLCFHVLLIVCMFLMNSCLVEKMSFHDLLFLMLICILFELLICFMRLNVENV